MNNLARQKLSQLIGEYGRDLSEDSRRCEALLRDVCGQYCKEIAVVVGAIKERIPADLLASKNTVPSALLLARLSKRLQENLGLTPEAAQWAVETWAIALESISDSDLQPLAPPASSNTPPQPTETPAFKNPTENSWPSEPPPVAPSYRKEAVFQPVPQPQVNPPTPQKSKTPSRA